MIGAITKLHESLKIFGLVSLNLEFSFHLLRYAHRPRLVNAENDGDVFGAHGLFVMDLGSCFYDVVDGACLRLLFLVNADFIVRVAKLTLPKLLVRLSNDARLSICHCTIHIEDSFAARAKLRVTSGDLSRVLEG